MVTWLVGRGEVGPSLRKRRQSNDAAEIQKTTRKYYEQLYVKKFSDLEEMDKYLETYSPSK